MSKTAEEGFEALIYPFSLAVRLWVVRGAEAERSTSCLKQSLPKLTGENLVVIQNDRSWQTMKTVDMI